MAKKSAPRPAPLKPSEPETAQKSHASVTPLIAALPAERRVTVVRTDVPTAVAIALGAAAATAPLREQIATELPKHPIEYFDRLREIALAAWWAHLRAQQSGPAAPGRLEQLLEEASTLRKALLVAAEALAHVGLVSEQTVAEIRKGSGQLDTANDLVALAALFHEAWERVQNRTAVTVEQVERAPVLGTELLVAIAARAQAREQTPAELSAAERDRVAAFSLLDFAYSETAWAVRYLRRHEDDPDAMMPSLYSRAGSGRPRRKEPDANNRGEGDKPEGGDEGKKGGGG